METALQERFEAVEGGVIASALFHVPEVGDGRGVVKANVMGGRGGGIGYQNRIFHWEWFNVEGRC